MTPHGITLYHRLEISECDQAFLDRSIARIANVDESKVKDKTVNDEHSPGIRRPRRNGPLLEYVCYTSSLQNFGLANLYSYMAGHLGASVNNLGDLQDFMLMVAAGIKDY